MNKSNPLRAQPPAPIPVNIITGFLGAGKTTAIQHLLRHKPAGEHWAVLVNEFGEVGIDGSLLGGLFGADDGYSVREVSGGCMCCTSALGMHVALNRLLVEERPDRLLIEPTGLGHPHEIAALLAGDFYRDWLTPGATLTLVDARTVVDPRYYEHPLYVAQLLQADRVIASKADLYGPADESRLRRFMALHPDLADKPLQVVSAGAVELAWLAPAAASAPEDGAVAVGADPDYPAPDSFAPDVFAPDFFAPGRAAPDNRAPGTAGPARAGRRALPGINFRPPPTGWIFPACGYITRDNSGDGYWSRGWVFHPTRVFAAQQLQDELLQLQAVRIKGVFITELGILGINGGNGCHTLLELDDAGDSRLELIVDDPGQLAEAESRLRRCLLLG